jgi:hypothetical protein
MLAIRAPFPERADAADQLVDVIPSVAYQSTAE